MGATFVVRDGNENILGEAESVGEILELIGWSDARLRIGIDIEVGKEIFIGGRDRKIEAISIRLIENRVFIDVNV